MKKYRYVIVGQTQDGMTCKVYAGTREESRRILQGLRDSGYKVTNIGAEVVDYSRQIALSEDEQEE